MRKQKLYTTHAVDDLIERYFAKGGEMYQIEEGGLGYGLLILTGYNLRSAVIKEVYLNCWSSAHKVRFYNELPKKYEKMIEEWEAKQLELEDE